MGILKVIGGLIVLFASPAMARDGTAWILTQKSGVVSVLRNGLQPASLQVRAALSPGDVIETGSNGRAMLTNGDDYVVVAPASRLMLPKDQAQTGFTRLMQQVGTMLYKVRHTGVPHFAVETPLLAAVVKGTSFTVVVDKDRAAVQVTDGIVEVSSAGGAARRLVERGATVYVGRARPDAIVEMKPGEILPAPDSNAPAIKIEGSGDAPLSAVTSLTAGLLQAVTTAPVRIVGGAAVPVTAVATASGGSAAATAPTTIAASTAAPVQAASTTGASAPIAVAVSTPGVAVSTSLGSTPTVTAAVSTPLGSTPTVTAAVSTPLVSTPLVSAPSVTAAISVPAITTPAVAATVPVPAVTTPAVTVAIAVPTVTAPAVTATVAVPAISTPVIATPTVVATVTTPTITTPTLAVTTPITPTITIPSVSIPSIGLTIGIR